MWQKKRLGDIATFVNGYPFKPSEWSLDGLEIIRIQNLTKSSKECNYYKGELNPKYKVLYGDILISWSATLGIFEWKGKEAWLNQHIFKVDFNKDPIDKKFFIFLIEHVLDDLKSQVHGATMKHITKSNFDNTLVPIPPLEQQKKIAEKLDKADLLRKKDQELLTQYDELTQAIFIDMFGDPVKNEKGWEIKHIEQLVSKKPNSIKRGPFGGALKKEIFVEKGYLVYEQYHALNNDFSMERYYINEEKFNELKGFEVNPKDIIISCSGVYLGKLAVIPENAKKGIINQALLKLTLNEEVMTNDFFVFHFSQPNFRNKYFDANRGAGIPNFPPMSEFKKFPFITPSIKLQNEFTEKIKNIEAQKTLAKKQAQESEDLFQALLQESFNFNS